MIFGATWSIAMRYLFGAGGRGSPRAISAIFGIGMSIVPLVTVLQVSDGMIRGIADRFIEVGTYHLQAITRRAYGIDELERIGHSLSELPGVTGVVSERQGIGLATANGRRTGTTIRAVSHDIWEQDRDFRSYIELLAGAFDLTEQTSAVVGRQIAETLGLSPGDRLQLLTVRSLPDGKFIPRVSTFVVTGIFTTGYQDLDRLWVYIPLERGLRILPLDTARQIIGIKIDDPYSLPNELFPTPNSIESIRLIRNVRATVGEGFRLYTWYSLQSSRYLSFRATKNLLIFIMALIIFVASFNISSNLIMLIYEKQSEIAILKSVGTSPRSIATIFLLCGFIIGSGGVIIGIALGVLIALRINELLNAIEYLIAVGQRIIAGRLETFDRSDFYLETIPIEIGLIELLLVAGLSILLAILAAVLPARRASRFRPLEVIRRA